MRGTDVRGPLLKEDPLWGRTWRFAYYYDIAAKPILEWNDTKVTLQRDVDIPEDIRSRTPTITKQELNQGNVYFEVVDVTQTPGENDADFLKRVRALLSSRGDKVVGDLRDTFRKVGEVVTVENSGALDPAPGGRV